MSAILGILNLTPDSYSDGGQFLDPERAIVQAQDLIKAGAAAIDLGPSSSHPGAPIISPMLEIERLSSVLPALISMNIPISVDSFHPDTQRYALSQGVSFLNDIHGFPHAEIYPVLADADCHLIIMHSVHGTEPAERVVTDARLVIPRIIDFFNQRISALIAAGIAKDRLILDPGMGFFLSAEPEASLVVLQKLDLLRKEFGLPLLVSVSRKSFIQRLTGKAPAMAGAGSLSAELFAARQGVDWIRTHDVDALRDGLQVQAYLAKALSSSQPAIA